MPTHSKKDLENGGSASQNELEGKCGLAGRCRSKGGQGTWKRKGGGGLVVRTGFRDVDGRLQRR